MIKFNSFSDFEKKQILTTINNLILGKLTDEFLIEYWHSYGVPRNPTNEDYQK